VRYPSPCRPGTVIYDGDCGFCARSIAYVRARLLPDVRSCVTFVPWQETALDEHALTRGGTPTCAVRTGPAADSILALLRMGLRRPGEDDVHNTERR
jgi:hypothetical protein